MSATGYEIAHSFSTNNMDAALMRVAEPDDVEKYHRVMCRFMAWKAGRPITYNGQGLQIDAYPKEHVFSIEERRHLTPLDICQWLCLLCYRKVDPTKEDRPIHGTRNTLLYHKKAL